MNFQQDLRKDIRRYLVSSEGQLSCPTHLTYYLNSVWLSFLIWKWYNYQDCPCANACCRSFLPDHLLDLLLPAFHSILFEFTYQRALWRVKDHGHGILTRMLRLSVNTVLPILPSGWSLAKAHQSPPPTVLLQHKPSINTKMPVQRQRSKPDLEFTLRQVFGKPSFRSVSISVSLFRRV